jgi:hypothetical protein
MVFIFLSIFFLNNILILMFFSLNLIFFFYFLHNLIMNTTYLCISKKKTNKFKKIKITLK